VTRSGNSLRSRGAVYTLRDRLTLAGYTVIRCGDPRVPVDLFAWGPAARLLLIQARSLRKSIVDARIVANVFRCDVAKIREITPPHGAEIQLWVLDGHSDWTVFAILQGGIMELGKEVQGREVKVK
jgi:hypothetical protein